MSQRTADELEQRRGLVLGLTLAEVLLLLLFLLMLALSWRMTTLQREAEQYQRTAQTSFDQLERLKATLVSLEPLLAELKSKGSVDAASAQELAGKIARADGLLEENAKLKRENTQLNNMLGNIKVVGSDLDRLRRIESAIAAAAKIDPDDPPEALIRAVEMLARLDPKTQAFDVKELTELITDSQKIKALEQPIAMAIRINPNNPPEVMRRALEILNRLGSDTQPGDVIPLEQQQSLSKQVENARQALNNAARSGNGLTYPPCWKTAEGKPVYIFDVTILDKGLVVRDATPSHTNHPDMSAVGAFDRNVPIDEGVFRRATQDLFKLSQTNNCRYYSIIRDGTGQTNKQRYKDMVRLVEGHFYKLDRPEPYSETPMGGEFHPVPQRARRQSLAPTGSSLGQH